jgi:hypothetical protein
MKIGMCTITPTWGDIIIWKYKSFEYQFEGHQFITDKPYECELRWSRKRDHAGISFTFGIRGLGWMNLNIHDHRHWDTKNNTWST